MAKLGSSDLARKGTRNLEAMGRREALTYRLPSCRVHCCCFSASQPFVIIFSPSRIDLTPSPHSLSPHPSPPALPCLLFPFLTFTDALGNRKSDFLVRQMSRLLNALWGVAVCLVPGLTIAMEIYSPALVHHRFSTLL